MHFRSKGNLGAAVSVLLCPKSEDISYSLNSRRKRLSLDQNLNFILPCGTRTSASKVAFIGYLIIVASFNNTLQAFKKRSKLFKDIPSLNEMIR